MSGTSLDLAYPNVDEGKLKRTRRRQKEVVKQVVSSVVRDA